MPDELMQDEQLEQPQHSDGGDVQQQGDYTGPANAEGVLNLPDTLVAAMKELCKKLDNRDKTARLQQVARCQRARFFERGQQYLNREKDTELYSLNPVTTPLWKQGGENPPKATLNIYYGYEKVWISTFSQTPCGVRFDPNDPMEPRQIAAAKEADQARKLICKLNPPKDLQAEVAEYIWTDGMAVLYSRKVTDKSKFGVDQNGQPRAYPEIEVGGLLEWKVPIVADGPDTWDYCRRQREMPISAAKYEYQDKRAQIKASYAGLGGDVDLSRQARVSTQEGIVTPGGGYRGQSGDAAAIDVTESSYWLRPSAFEDLPDQYRDEANKYFPQGARLVFVGDEYVRSFDEDMGDHIEAVKLGKKKGNNRPGLGEPEIDVQEMFNNGMNISKDCFERTIPHGYFDQDLIPAESINQQKSEYGYKHPVQMPTDGQPLQNHFHEEATVNPPTLLVQYLDTLQGPLSQFLTGQQPSLFGAQMGKDDRVGVYQQAKQMALGLMGLIWVPYKQSYANSMRQCIKILSDSYGQGTTLAVMVNGEDGKPQVVKVSVDNLKGDFLAYPDTDESYPETWSDKKQQFTDLIMSSEKNPELGQILLHPDNLRLAKKLIGLDDLVIPGADACDKQMQEIEEMESQPPVPNPQMVQEAQAQGMPIDPSQIPLVSSVDLGKYDDHASELATCIRWINSQTGQQAKRENPQWYQNVELHADAHQQALQSSQANQQQSKPPSESMNFKDMPPSGKIQMAAQSGIQLSPEDIAQAEAAEMAKQQMQAKNKQLPSQQ